jgi:Glycosyl hydrolases family 16/Malectin domain
MSQKRAIATGVVLAAVAALGPLQPAHGEPLSSGSGSPAVDVPAAAVSPSAPVRVVSWPTAITDHAQRIWQPDTPYAIGGVLASTSHSINATANPELYQHARIGGTSYQFPVSQSGTYFVDIFTAEIENAQPGQRRWNVTAEGQRAATAVDVAYTAGQFRAWHVMFSVPVTDGALDLSVTGTKGLPIVSAVEVDFQSANVAPKTLLDDEFNGAAGQPANPDIWTNDVGGKGWGNDMLEYDTARRSNSHLDGDGHLLIIARREKYTGPDGVTDRWTSARLKTVDHFTFQYGSVDASIRVPSGKGLWPAFWGLGDNFTQVGWPACGEIDILETRGAHPRFIYGALHALRRNHSTWTKAEKYLRPTPISDNFHDYGMVWGPTGIALSFDKHVFLTMSSVDVPPSQYWEFSHSFFLLLDLAVGGRWGGAPDKTTPAVSKMAVDYVRVTD